MMNEQRKMGYKIVNCPNEGLENRFRAEVLGASPINRMLEDMHIYVESRIHSIRKHSNCRYVEYLTILLYSAAIGLLNGGKVCQQSILIEQRFILILNKC